MQRICTNNQIKYIRVGSGSACSCPCPFASASPETATPKKYHNQPVGSSYATEYVLSVPAKKICIFKKKNVTYHILFHYLYHTQILWRFWSMLWHFRVMYANTKCHAMTRKW